MNVGSIVNYVQAPAVIRAAIVSRDMGENKYALNVFPGETDDYSQPWVASPCVQTDPNQEGGPAVGGFYPQA